MIAARVVRTKGGKLLDKVPFDPTVVEGAIRDRDELYGVHVHAFMPKPGRDYWLITWPVELGAEQAAIELLYFVLGAVPEGDIEMPKPIEDEGLDEIFNQPVVFSTRVVADGTTVADDVRSIGDRFVVAA